MKYLNLLGMALLGMARAVAIRWCFSRLPVPFGLAKKLFDFGMGQKGIHSHTQE